MKKKIIFATLALLIAFFCFFITAPRRRVIIAGLCQQLMQTHYVLVQKPQSYYSHTMALHKRNLADYTLTTGYAHEF